MINIEQQNGSKKKRHRRTVSEIDRQYQCPIEQCDKAYGNESSLHQHIKSKHEQYWELHGNDLIRQKKEIKKEMDESMEDED